MNTKLTLLATAALGLSLTATAQPPSPYNNGYNNQGYGNPTNGPGYAPGDSVPVGAEIRIRTLDRIDARDRSDRRVYNGVVESDVIAPDGRVVVPRGANAELVVQDLGPREMAVDLESVTVNGRRYMVAAEDYTRARRSGVGENGRTAKYVGGGALFGTVLGAIAGGGKGAAIGALAGGAAGAGAQTLTRGADIHIPSETLLTFRLDRPLTVGTGAYSRDNGYDRDGYHYHDDYYQRNQQQQYRTDQRP